MREKMNILRHYHERLWVFFLMALLFPTAVQAANPLDPEAVKTPQMSPKLNLGKMLYDGMCASCHGKNVAGTDKGPTFLHRVYHPGHHGDGAFFLAPKRGTKAHHWPFGDMPPVDGITDNQIEKIIFYIRTLQKENGIF
jgi:mono/diheme cytochrome c family protein